MIYTFICRRCDDLPVAACCRVMGVSPSGFYAWRARPVSDRDWDDVVLTNTIVDVHGPAGALMGRLGCTPICASTRTCAVVANGSSG
jgi:hypothetical protein